MARKKVGYMDSKTDVQVSRHLGSEIDKYQGWAGYIFDRIQDIEMSKKFLHKMVFYYIKILLYNIKYYMAGTPA